MPEPDARRVEQYIRNATVKIYANDQFAGTGFFISPAGYVLTAYHCVGSAPNAIQIETPYDGRFPARLAAEKSLPAYDLALLEAEHAPGYWLPLARIAADRVSDPVVTIGYPAGHLALNQEVGTYRGHISRWRSDDRFELSDAIKGKGHSGSSVYHYGLRRVVGVVTDRYHEDTMADAGLATRLDRLFAKWPDLEDLNRQSIEWWDRRLQTAGHSACQYPLVLAILPGEESSATLLAALRSVFEDDWGCQVLTAEDRQYDDNTLENLRVHLEQAAVFVAEVSHADPAVMFVLGAACFAHNQAPLVLLSQTPDRLPPPLQGWLALPYTGTAPDLVADLKTRLGKLAPLQTLLQTPGRQHFLSTRCLQALSRLPLSDATWQRLQEHYPSREAWQTAGVAEIRTLLGTEADLAEVLLKRIRESQP